jgi:RNase P subunit RPR2
MTICLGCAFTLNRFSTEREPIATDDVTTVTCLLCGTVLYLSVES